MKRPLITTVLCIMGFLASCRALPIPGSPRATLVTSLYPPTAFQEADLIGIWEKQVGGLNSQETLTINTEHHFRQVFDDQEDAYHFETTGEWWLEKKDSGCTYLHLEGMRYFYYSREAAEKGNRIGSDNDVLEFWDPCEEQFIRMPGKVILLVAEQSDFAFNLKLQYLKPTNDMADVLLERIETQVEQSPTP